MFNLVDAIELKSSRFGYVVNDGAGTKPKMWYSLGDKDLESIG